MHSLIGSIYLKLYFLENVRIINQLTNLQTTVLRVFILSLIIPFKLVKRSSMLFLLSTKRPYFSAAMHLVFST